MPNPRIESSIDAYNLLKFLCTQEVEEFWIIALSSDKRVLKLQCLFRGTVDRCPVYPRDLVRFVCSENASAFVIAHNHPTGDPKPSRTDNVLTKKIALISRLIEVPLLDHVIIGRTNYFSFADKQRAKLHPSGGITSVQS